MSGCRSAGTRPDNSGMPTRNLNDWLDYIEQQHPKSASFIGKAKRFWEDVTGV